ncbi:MAG: DNA repair protein RadC [candidate division WOR-3 bacterium]|nr:DNA repair protein RadC [candidate division WOR-3 bacterium]
MDSKVGHRKRLREKFMKSGLLGLHDYEIVELLLTLGTPRKDCKQQAKALMKKFKTLRGVIDADKEELCEINEVGPKNIFGIRFVREISEKYLEDRIIKQEIYRTPQDVFNYLYVSMRGLKKEVFKTLFLDVKNRLIATEKMFKGTVSSSVVYPREIVKRAIKKDASSVILVHNHPSGDPTPSPEDRRITRDVVDALEAVDIKVLDHIIIGDNRYFSFASEKLLD